MWKRQKPECSKIKFHINREITKSEKKQGFRWYSLNSSIMFLSISSICHVV